MNIKKVILKRKARKYYIDYHKKFNNYSCGGNLAETISPELKKLKDKFNATLDELAKIDPECLIKRM